MEIQRGNTSRACCFHLVLNPFKSASFVTAWVRSKQTHTEFFFGKNAHFLCFHRGSQGPPQSQAPPPLPHAPHPSFSREFPVSYGTIPRAKSHIHHLRSPAHQCPKGFAPGPGLWRRWGREPCGFPCCSITPLQKTAPEKPRSSG